MKTCSDHQPGDIGGEQQDQEQAYPENIHGRAVAEIIIEIGLSPGDIAQDVPNAIDKAGYKSCWYCHYAPDIILLMGRHPIEAFFTWQATIHCFVDIPF